MNENTKRAFIVYAWHNEKTSLYPPISDGIEYIESAIKAIKKACEANGCDVRTDIDSFLPGKTIRENLEHEIKYADLVIILLDGMRPNVLYEMGLAYGLSMNAPSSEKKIILSLCEMHAPVLVRNYYRNPMRTPVLSGGDQTIINPEIDIPSVFSDNSDLLLLRYDRFDLYRLENMISDYLKRIKVDIARIEATQKTSDEIDNDAERIERDANEGVNSASSDEGGIWALYKSGRYREVISMQNFIQSPKDKKALAFSFMKVQRFEEATKVWDELLDTNLRKSARYYLGICKYMTMDYLDSYMAFENAKRYGFTNPSIDDWIKRSYEKAVVDKKFIQTPSDESKTSDNPTE